MKRYVSLYNPSPDHRTYSEKASLIFLLKSPKALSILIKIKAGTHNSIKPRAEPLRISFADKLP